MTRYIDRNLLEHIMWRPEEVVPTIQTIASQPRVAHLFPNGQYQLMDVTSTYALGVEALREACRASESHDIHIHEFVGDKKASIYRPLTFKENILARVTDFNKKLDESGAERSLDDRLRLFGRWLDSCTGIAYQAGTSNMKIVPICQNLIEIDSSFKEHYVAVDYASIDGMEIDRSKGKYNLLLTQEEVIVHPAWLAAVEEDKELLKDYADIVFTQLKEKYQRDTGMRFWVRDTTQEDELRALFVDKLNYSSDASGINNLYDCGSFLLVAPSDSPKAQRARISDIH